MSRYIPMPAYPDAMPVDISFVFADEKPAGKRGFTYVDGDNVRFADGTLARFWGVNFNGGACFPDKDYAPKVARRLAQAGCNIARFHQLDAEWDTPNIFAYSKGKRCYTTRVLDEKSMDCLDYFVYCLKEEGIYCYLDLITYRKFKEGDGVIEHELLGDKARPWCMTNPHLIELQKEFATNIWTHYNPYTKLQYKDDPVFVLSEIINECDLFVDQNSWRVEYTPAPYYFAEFRQMFKAWLDEQGMEYDWENCDFFDQGTPMLLFKQHLTRKYFREMYDHMRGLGVKCPITGTNWTMHISNVRSHDEMDFTDSHHYYYDWNWGNTERICKNYSITQSPVVFPNLAQMKVPGKPFFVSEWDMPWPNSYRAEGPIYYAAVGALQNWTGFTIHTYSYGTRLDKMDILGREQSTPVAGVPYREGIFSTWNDPAKFGLFYHSALMLRRCDITPADKKVAVYAPDMAGSPNTAYQGLLEQHQAASVFEDKLPEGFDELVLDKDVYPHAQPGKIVSDNGQLWRDLVRQIGAVDTPRSKIAYGFIGRGNSGSSTNKRTPKSVDFDGLQITCYTDFGVVALSSLTDEALDKTDNILLSAIGRARNTDAQFDGEKMIDIGRAPIMAEVIQADIRLKTEHGNNLRVWGVNAEGFYAGKLATTYEDGYLCFHIGDENNPACYYLIVKE